MSHTIWFMLYYPANATQIIVYFVIIGLLCNY